LKWIGQHIVDLIARFRNDVYLENISGHGSDPDRFLTMDSSTGKVTYRTGAEVLSDGGGVDANKTISSVTILDDTGGYAGWNAHAGGKDALLRLVGGEGIDTNGNDQVNGTWPTITISGEDASTSNKGVASFNSNDFSVSSGAVSLIGTGMNPPNIHGSVIKLIPSDFASNDDGGNTKFGIGYVDSAGTAYGMRAANSLVELFAFVSIPEGMKATHVHIYAKGTYSTEVFEVQINATTMSSKGTGNCNTNLAITEVESSATNFLAISVNITATTDKVYGGIVTIAAIT